MGNALSGGRSSNVEKMLVKQCLESQTIFNVAHKGPKRLGSQIFIRRQTFEQSLEVIFLLLGPLLLFAANLLVGSADEIDEGRGLPVAHQPVLVQVGLGEDVVAGDDLAADVGQAERRAAAHVGHAGLVVDAGALQAVAARGGVQRHAVVLEGLRMAHSL